jgi:phosphoglycerate dehydrogenase-like enzyme
MVASATPSRCYKSLHGLLKESDFLTIHVPLTQGTRHSIGRRELSLMKRTAYLVNTSRGSVVDEAALIEALKEKVIAGAALDVYEREPVDADNPLLSMDNVVVTPHIGSASIETRTAMAVLAARNMVATLKGDPSQSGQQRACRAMRPRVSQHGV